MKKLSENDSNVPKLHSFQPLRSVGVHLPPCPSDPSPATLFKMYFDDNIVKQICDASNEYAERNKDKKKQMYQYFKKMTREDFYAIVGTLVHLGYRKIPR